MSDPYKAGKCPKCGEFAIGTYRHIGAPVYCENRHEWQRPTIEDLQKENDGLKLRNSYLEQLEESITEDVRKAAFKNFEEVRGQSIANQLCKFMDENKELKELMYIMFKGAWQGGLNQASVLDGKEEGGVFGVLQAFKNCMAYYNTVVEVPLISDVRYDELLDIAEKLEGGK